MSGVRRQRIGRVANIAWLTARPPKAPTHAPIKAMREAAQARANSLGYGFDVFQLMTAKLNERQVDRILRARGVAGILIEPLPQKQPVLPIPWEGYPLATIGRSLASPLIHHTLGYWLNNTKQVLGELQQRGYERIGFMYITNAEKRFDYAPSMYFDFHLKSVPRKRRIAPVCSDNWTSEMYAAWIEKYRPNAIIGSFADQVRHIRDAGYRVPEDIGYATLSRNDYFPECSGIRQPYQELAESAVDLLVSQIQSNQCGLPARPKALFVEGDWVEGETLRATTKKDASARVG